MRTAYELGYNVVTLKDCAATVSQTAHENALEHDFPMFSHPMTHDEFLTKLAGTKSEKKAMQTAVGERKGCAIGCDSWPGGSRAWVLHDYLHPKPEIIINPKIIAATSNSRRMPSSQGSNRWIRLLSRAAARICW